MARRMEIELTSSRDDGTWTWRAAGAREPRGILEAKMAPPGAAVGLVLRVDADFGLDGITVTAVLPSREKEPAAGRIELAPATPHEAGTVTTSLVGRGRDRGERRWGERGERADRPRRERGQARDAERGRPAGAERGRAAGAERGARPPRRTGEPSLPVEGRPAAGQRPAAQRAPGQRPSSTERPARGRPARLVPGTAHRDALIAALPPEQRPIAEQLAAGGLPAVRRALAEERAAARAAGRPEVAGDAIVALAEQLLTPVKEAVWLDRAQAVEARLEAVSLRDLRAAVTSASARDETGRELLGRLRTALEGRVTKLRTTWEHDISHALEEGRLLQALRLSTRPPEPTARFPASLVTPLAEAASAALTPATSPERWVALLEASAASPLRRSVRPAGLPADDPEGRARQTATQLAGRIPALAALLGLAMPPPPRPIPAPPRQRAGGSVSHADAAAAPPPAPSIPGSLEPLQGAPEVPEPLPAEPEPLPTEPEVPEPLPAEPEVPEPLPAEPEGLAEAEVLQDPEPDPEPAPAEETSPREG